MKMHSPMSNMPYVIILFWKFLKTGLNHSVYNEICVIDKTHYTLDTWWLVEFIEWSGWGDKSIVRGICNGFILIFHVLCEYK